MKMVSENLEHEKDDSPAIDLNIPGNLSKFKLQKN